ncbi:hypothetical protein D3C71_1380660 [compost metagenome]
MVHATALLVDVLRDSRIYPALREVGAERVDGIQHGFAFLHKASLIQSIGVHHGHVTEHGSILFVAEGEAKCPAQILLDAAEPGIQSVADLLIKQMAVHRLNDGRNLLFRRNSAHDREDLAGERHPHALRMVPFHPLAIVVVIAIEP